MNLSRLFSAMALILVLALASCGGDDSSESGGGGGGESAEAANGDEVYAKAMEGLDELESGKLDAELTTILRLGNEQRLFVAEKATFADGGAAKLPKFDLVINVEQTGGEEQETRAVNTGEDFLAMQQGSDSFESQGAQALDALEQTYKQEQDKLEQGRIPLLALTPADWLKSGKVEGTESVDGVTVQKVTGDLDVPAFLKDLETGKNSSIGMGVTLTQNARELLEPDADIKSKSIVALIGEEDGLLRRLTAKVDGNVGGGVSVDFDVQMAELNEEQTIEAPAAP